MIQKEETQLAEEERRKIYEEEKARIEARKQIKEEEARKQKKKQNSGCLIIIGIIVLLILGRLSCVNTTYKPKLKTELEKEVEEMSPGDREFLEKALRASDRMQKRR